MRFDIRPLEGVGPVQLGMTRKQVAKAMATVTERGERRGDSDYYFASSFQVHYDPHGNVEYIALASHDDLEFVFEGVDVFDVSAKKLLEHVEKFDAPDPGLSTANYEYIFPRLILTLWEPDSQYDHKGGGKRSVFGSVGIGNAKYLSAIRKLHQPKSPFDTKWVSGAQLAPRHRKAVAALNQVQADSAFGSGPDVVRIDQEGDVRAVSLLHRKATDATLQHLKGFTMLETLNLAGTAISDAGLTHIRSMKNLKGLILNAGGITDDGLVHLKRLTSLTELTLPNSITAAGLEHLKALTSLESLDLQLSRKTQVGLLHLKVLPKLRKLTLAGDISNGALRTVGTLRNLEELDFSFCQEITDGGLSYLKPLKNLRSLGISRNIGDSGIQHLRVLPRLEELKAWSSRITDEGVKKLRESLSNLEVYR